MRANSSLCSGGAQVWRLSHVTAATCILHCLNTHNGFYPLCCYTARNYARIAAKRDEMGSGCTAVSSSERREVSCATQLHPEAKRSLQRLLHCWKIGQRLHR